MGGTIVGCEEHTCAYCIDERCIAERIKMVLVPDENLGLDSLTCDTYEHKDAWIPEPEFDSDTFDDEQWELDWKCSW